METCRCPQSRVSNDSYSLYQSLSMQWGQSEVVHVLCIFYHGFSFNLRRLKRLLTWDPWKFVELQLQKPWSLVATLQPLQTLNLLLIVDAFTILPQSYTGKQAEATICNVCLEEICTLISHNLDLPKSAISSTHSPWYHSESSYHNLRITSTVGGKQSGSACYSSQLSLD